MKKICFTYNVFFFLCGYKGAFRLWKFTFCVVCVFLLSSCISLSISSTLSARCAWDWPVFHKLRVSCLFYFCAAQRFVCVINVECGGGAFITMFFALLMVFDPEMRLNSNGGSGCVGKTNHKLQKHKKFKRNLLKFFFYRVRLAKSYLVSY